MNNHYFNNFLSLEEIFKFFEELNKDRENVKKEIIRHENNQIKLSFLFEKIIKIKFDFILIQNKINIEN